MYIYIYTHVYTNMYRITQIDAKKLDPLNNTLACLLGVVLRALGIVINQVRKTINQLVYLVHPTSKVDDIPGYKWDK